MRFSSEGETARQLIPDDPGQQLDPNWSPDGSKIVYGGESGDTASTIRILELATHKVSNLRDSQGLFSPRWSPNGRYILAFSADSAKLSLFDFQTQKWTELAKGPMGWLNWSKDGLSVYVLHYKGRGAVLRIRISDHKTEQVADLNNFVTCPVSAIFVLDDLPEKWKQYTELNESYVKAGKFMSEEFAKHQVK